MVGPWRSETVFRPRQVRNLPKPVQISGLFYRSQARSKLDNVLVLVEDGEVLSGYIYSWLGPLVYGPHIFVSVSSTGMGEALV